ncbi:MAG: hypothetical protein N2691_02740 [Patescibacteria group bacterium]|nr:hypothetical protein [Patescibacteria group bacterium]
MDSDLPPLSGSLSSAALASIREDGPSSRRKGISKKTVKIISIVVLILFGVGAVGALGWYIVANSNDAAASEIADAGSPGAGTNRARTGDDSDASNAGRSAVRATPYVIPTIAGLEPTENPDRQPEISPRLSEALSPSPGGKTRVSPIPRSPTPTLRNKPLATITPTPRFGLASPTPGPISPSPKKTGSLTAASPTSGFLPVTIAPTATPMWELKFSAGSYSKTTGATLPVYQAEGSTTPSPGVTATPAPTPYTPAPLAKLSATLTGPVKSGDVVCFDESQKYFTREVDDTQVERLCDLFTKPLELPQYSCFSYTESGVAISELVYPTAKDTIDKCYLQTDPGSYIMYVKVFYNCSQSALLNPSTSSCANSKSVFSGRVTVTD